MTSTYLKWQVEGDAHDSWCHSYYKSNINDQNLNTGWSKLKTKKNCFLIFKLFSTILILVKSQIPLTSCSMYTPPSYHDPITIILAPQFFLNLSHENSCLLKTLTLKYNLKSRLRISGAIISSVRARASEGFLLNIVISHNNMNQILYKN